MTCPDPGGAPFRPCRYLLIISHDDKFQPTPRLVAAIAEWTEGQTKAGVLIHSNPLRPPGDAVTVRVRRGVSQVTPGPFSRSREQMCAYALIAVKDRDAAIAVASEHPMATVATIEVRPVWEVLQQGQTPTSLAPQFHDDHTNDSRPHLAHNKHSWLLHGLSFRWG